jgi:hypothetical protein
MVSSSRKEEGEAEMKRGGFALLAAAALLGGCAHHRIVTPDPYPGGAPVTAQSTALGWGAVQRRTVMADCPTQAIDEVRVRQSFLESLVTVLTLGLVAPAQVSYVCRAPDTPEGTFGAPPRPER